MSAWIRMIPLSDAAGLLKEMYRKVTTPHGTVDNVMRAHSLRPHTMEGHLALYRSVLHNPGNTLPLWFLEVVASYPAPGGPDCMELSADGKLLLVTSRWARRLTVVDVESRKVLRQVKVGRSPHGVWTLDHAAR